ncbi:MULTISPECIES: hypothetical protein [Streptomyces]|uniref:hypothetical protein n=1 Tax=Streptomyces TaxID=1883 RepID=UPI001673249A|nr:hypothetical protein [Streptomyces canarius]
MGATSTGQAQAVGGVAVTGALIVEGGVRVTAPSTAARTGYREQVRRISPQHLHGRAEELAALAAFCTEPGEHSYRWLRGPAWAGKSALLSWFVLHPPEGVHVVPFFITGRFSGQNDRTGFCDVVMEQLAAFLGQPLPAPVTDATREGHVLSLIREAAHVCQEKGTRLVLVVDGLDEDHGVTARPESYSIAALLPSRPEAGLRVIVAGRSHPPLPADVPDDHPLRDPGVVRDLSVSPHAEAVRVDAERELQRLAEAPGLEREILGLLTAADGGLTERDLAELTGASAYTVGRHIRTVSGRTFTSLLSTWTKEEVYVLGHDELRSTALRMLGSVSVARDRERIHRWADGYRADGWPARTPEYLLHGYFRTLRDAGDLPRVAAHATDAARHNRMLHVTGGDAAAFAEIKVAQELILGEGDPDLLAMARLAVHHDALKARNDDIPVTLPALWAALGAPERAEALLNGIVVAERHSRALLSLLETYLTAGDLVRARALAETATRAGVRARALADVAKALCSAGDLAAAEDVAMLVEDPRQQVSTLSDVVRTAVRTGDSVRARRLVERAERGALNVITAKHRAAAIRSVAESLACLGEHARALSLVRTIPSPFHRGRALGNLALTVTLAGDLARWEALSAEAEAIAHALPQPSAARLLSSLARTAVRAGQPERAKDLAQEATRLAQGLENPAERATVLVPVVMAVSAAGDPGLARLLTQSISVPDRRVWALVQLVKGGALSLPECVVELRRAGSASVSQGELVAVARVAAVDMEEPALAEAIAREVRSPARRLHLLLELARKYAIDGALDRAHTLRAQAEVISRSLLDPQEQIEAIVGTAHLDALLGQGDRARQLAETAEARLRDGTSDAGRQSRALLGLARTLLAMGDVERTRALGRQAMALADGIGQPGQREQVHSELISLALTLGDLDWAGLIAQGHRHPYQRAKDLVRIARALAEAGAQDRCLRVAADIGSLADTLPLHGERSAVLTELTKILTLLGHHERAEEAAHKIPDLQQRARVFVELAKHTEERHTKRLLARVLAMTGWAEPLADVALMAPSVVQAVADEQLTTSSDRPRGREPADQHAGGSVPHRHVSEPSAYPGAAS